MKTLTCAAARRSLQAFHDAELPVSQQIAVWAHVEWCGECAAALADLQLVRAAMLAATQGRRTLSGEDAASFSASVVNRLKAERDTSWLARLEVMFEDMRLGYAGLGAAVATMVCVVIMSSMMRFATIERPDSLAAIVTFLATPGSNQNPVPIDARVLLPRALDSAFSAGENDTSAEVDAVFTLAAVVTREGRIANLELLHSNGGPQLADQARLVEGLLDAVSRARFEPARMAGLPVAVNMVWLVARTTVRPTKNVPAVPLAKKRVASLTTSYSHLVMA
ncbi:MAG: hypothetical protein DMF92_05950 [Acidobacteria bacterium]|nr:MAG: hypothetical protein DMF92_05950 [Acidobacteriota bacterium]